MIHASLTQDKAGRLIAYHAKGHADHGEYGHDIVCSAVSVLGVTCVNSLESILNINVVLENNREGLISFRLPSPLRDDEMHDAQILMKALQVGLQGIAEEYPDNLSLSIQ